ncbi:MAG: polyprenyl synthetase family protein [Pseudomonadota bacterium]
MNVQAFDTVTPVLEEYGSLTRAAMDAYLPKWEPRAYLYDPIADYPARGGKMMRPSICIATAAAFGAPPERAVKAAVSIEMLHNALLIHDDIEDESEERRGAATLHVKHGTALALNAGDALAMMSMRPLFDTARSIAPNLAMGLFQDFERMGRESAEGQAMELGWRADPTVRVTRNDYLEMVLKKTCWLAGIFPTRLGAMLGLSNNGVIAPDAFIRFGFFFGAAFQIHDDVMNLQERDAYGKEMCGDLWEAKRTLMLIDLAEQFGDADTARLQKFLAQTRETREETDVLWLLDVMHETGALDRAINFAKALAQAAVAEFDQAFASVPASRDKTFIRDLTTWTFQRGH